MPQFDVTIRIECGDMTCAREPRRFCGQLGSRQFGQVPHCMLYGVDLGELDGWVARCADCLAANPPPPPAPPTR